MIANLKRQGIFPFLSFFIPFILYILTLSPSINFGDSGELVTAAYTLGIPHPPGSPIWVILAKIFTFLPFGNIAYRVNISSAFFAASACFVLYLICKKFLTRFEYGLNQKKDKSADLPKKYIEVISVSSAVIFGALMPVWSFAVVTEVYTLNTLFFALVLYFITLFQETGKFKFLYFSSFFLGLGITNHYLILFLCLAGLIWLIFHAREILFNGKVLGISLICLFIGLSVFVYLPVRSAANPAIDWGNPETLTSFVDVVSRKQFRGGKALSKSLLPKDEVPKNNVFSRLFNAVATTFQSVYLVYGLFSLVIITGLYAALRYLRKIYLPYFYSFIFECTVLAFAISYSLSPGDRATPFMAAYLSLSLAGAVGMFYLIYLLEKNKFRIFTNFFDPVRALIIFIPVVFILLNYPKADMSHNSIAETHAKKILEVLPQKAVIFAEENNWLFPLLYIQAVEKKRLDVTIYDRNGNLLQNIYGDELSIKKSEDDFERLRRKVEMDIVLHTGRPAFYAVDKTFENYGYTDVSPYGILYRQSKSKEVNFDVYKDILDIDFKDFSKYYGSEYMIAFYHFQYGEKLRREGNMINAINQFNQAAAWGKNDAVMLNNLAVIYYFMHENERTKQVLQQALNVNKKNIRANKNLGLVYENEGNFIKAEEYYTKALEINEKHVETIISLASLYARTGRKDKAIYGYKLALTLDPQNEQLQKKVKELTQ